MSVDEIKHQDFADRFRVACRLKDLDDKPQDELGKILGISGPMVNKYRRGHSLPSMDTAVVICNLTGVSIDWLLRGKGQMVSGESYSLKELWYSFSKEERLEFFSDLDSDKETSRQ